jgi:hypothetical protein
VGGGDNVALRRLKVEACVGLSGNEGGIECGQGGNRGDGGASVISAHPDLRTANGVSLQLVEKRVNAQDEEGAREGQPCSTPEVTQKRKLSEPSTRAKAALEVYSAVTNRRRPLGTLAARRARCNPVWLTRGKAVAKSQNVRAEQFSSVSST